MAWPDMWPFPQHELTTYHAPAMRIDAVNEYAARATGADTPEQRQLADELARQIQIETDPLVRKAIVRSISEFRTPMTQQVLEAGLADEDAAVRLACCKALAVHGGPPSIAPLAQTLQSDKDLDVRMAAAEALGQFKTPESMQALTVALDDRDPALQYMGVQSMKSISGKDYGGDIQAWRQVAAGQTPPAPKPPSLAQRIRSVSPF